MGTPRKSYWNHRTVRNVSAIVLLAGICAVGDVVVAHLLLGSEIWRFVVERVIKESPAIFAAALAVELSGVVVALCLAIRVYRLKQGR